MRDEGTLHAAGYERRWDLSVLLFERALALTVDAPLADEA